MHTAWQHDDGFQRKTISYFPSEQQQHRQELESFAHVWMFIDDVRQSIMPIGGRAQPGRAFTIEVTPNESAFRTIISEAFVSHQHRNHYSFTQGLSEFITDIAHQLAYRGCVHYEVVPWGEPEGANPTDVQILEPLLGSRRFQVVLIPGRIINIAGHTFQLIPRVEQAQQRKRFIHLTNSQVWSVSLPEELGTPRSHRAMLRAMARASTTLPTFAMTQLDKPPQATDFTFRDFHEQQELAMAHETALWGWPGRSMWREQTLEYFMVYRELRFAHSMAILREHILFMMNELLQRRQLPTRLAIKGLPTTKEVQAYIEQLHSGELSFKEALQLVDI
ncbi:MAG TPA: hypothetical protein VFZ66_27430 [Herpetosiphonaceae bacterium]